MIRFTDGTTYTGWRAVPWLILLSPVWLAVFAFGFLLLVLRWVTGRDRIMGYQYIGPGTWRRTR